MKLIFSNNDIINLNYNDSNQHGLFDHLQWSVKLEDPTQTTARIISSHEYWHNDLNNITGYGALLIAYAILSAEKSDKSDFYKKTLGQLVERCKVVHEAYATWMSINEFKKSINDNIEEKLLNENHEYRYYYDCAEQFVKNLKNTRLKKFVISGLIPACFQSVILVNRSLEDLSNFNLSTIQNSEFPESRFQYLQNHLPEDYLLNCVSEFIKSRKNHQDYHILMDVLFGNEDRAILLKPENQHLFVELIEHVHDNVCILFEEKGSFSIKANKHMPYFERITKQIYKLCPESNIQMTVNDSPDDFIRNGILDFEKETLLFSDTPIPCYIMQPEAYEKKIGEYIYNAAKVTGYVYVTARNSMIFFDQYEIKTHESIDWLEQSMGGPFTAIKTIDFQSGEPIAFYFPFKTPDDLRKFLKEHVPDFPVIGTFSLSTMKDKNFNDKWSSFFVTNCTSSCKIMDISPLYCIEKILPNEGNITHSKLFLDFNGKKYTGMIFMTSKQGQPRKFMVFPCSEEYSDMLCGYIKLNFQSYVYSADADINSKNILTLMAFYLWGERKFSFDQRKINFI